MKTYKISTQKEIEKFKNEAHRKGCRYDVNGHLEINCPLNLTELSLFVDGNIKTNNYIETEASIVAGGNIETNSYIHTEGCIISKGYIEAEGFLKAKEFIEVFSYIKVNNYISSEDWVSAGGFLHVNRYIKAKDSISAGPIISKGYIKAGKDIDSKGMIKAGTDIISGRSIISGLFIECKGVLKYKLKCFAGINVMDIENYCKTITCGKHEGGKIEYGILKEIGVLI